MIGLTCSWHVPPYFYCIKEKKRYNYSCTQTDAWYSSATQSVGARTVSLIAVHVIEYFLVRFQAFPQQCCVGTVVGRSLDSGGDTRLCGPGLQSKLHSSSRAQWDRNKVSFHLYPLFLTPVKCLWRSLSGTVTTVLSILCCINAHLPTTSTFQTTQKLSAIFKQPVWVGNKYVM